MHTTSRLKFESFLATYVAQTGPAEGRRILDIGSRVVSADAYSYRQSAVRCGLEYIGLDIEHGENVDIVPRNPYSWGEIPDESFDYVVSGQSFEHNPFFWVTFCEIARVLKQNGVACIIAPSGGPVHRWPLDCWRFYPDSWGAVCALSGMKIAETIREPKAGPVPVGGVHFIDSAVIASKPTFDDAHAKLVFQTRLKDIVAPFERNRYDVPPVEVNSGSCFRHYSGMLRAQARRQRIKAGRAE